MITSSGNAQIRNVINLKKKARERREQGLFLVEGLRMFLEAEPGRIEKIFISESFYKKNGREEKTARALERCGYELVSDAVFEAMSDTRTPQGILCLVRQFHYREEELTGGGRTGAGTSEAISSDISSNIPSGISSDTSPDIISPAGTAADGTAALCMVLEDIQDPGNLGTILRAAEGAGVTGILMSGGCVDIYNPKVIRSTMGSIYRVPFAYTPDLRGTLCGWKERGIALYAAHLSGEKSYDEERYTGPSAFLIGNEGQGLTEETAALADRYIRIPMLGQVESLNAGVASAILMYEAARQRRTHRP